MLRTCPKVLGEELLSALDSCVIQPPACVIGWVRSSLITLGLGIGIDPLSVAHVPEFQKPIVEDSTHEGNLADLAGRVLHRAGQDPESSLEHSDRTLHL